VAERSTEYIKFDTEQFKLTALAAIAVGGGTVSLLLGPVTLVRLVLIGSGLLLTGGLLLALLRFRRTIRTRIDTLKEEQR
jgi:hypothetical protein